MEKDIQTLIKRFMAGQTSIEEEDRIAEYLRTHDVGEDLQPYKEMFAWFDQGMPLGSGQEDKSTSGQVDKLASQQADKQTRTQDKPRISHKLRYLFTATAAAIAMLIVLTWPKTEQPQTAESTPTTALPEPVRPETKADTLTADTATVSTPKRKKRRRSVRRDMYKPMPPKVYIAEAAQDTISKEAEMIAEEKIKEAEKRQEEILNDIYNDYRRMEAGIEIYLTALENYDVEEEYY